MKTVVNQLKEIASAIFYAAEAVELEDVLQRIAEVSRRMVGAKYAALGIPDGQGSLRYFKVAGINPEVMEHIAHLPQGKGLIGAIMNERRTLLIKDIHNDPRSAGFPKHHPFMNTFLGVPIQIGEQLFGMFYLCDKENGEFFNEEDQWLVETMAGYAALAIAGAELRVQQSRLKLLEERERIAMELHDGIIQSLYALGMHIDLLRTENKPIDGEQLTPVIIGLNEVIEDIRRYILNLRQQPNRQKSIRECLVEMVERLHVSGKIQIMVDAPEITPPFTPATFEAICLIINEAVSNAVRHAEASQIQVHAQLVDGHFNVCIEDNGKGFDMGAIPNTDGLGLRNIHQRTRLYGGEVKIDTAPEKGTKVYLTIPT